VLHEANWLLRSTTDVQCPVFCMSCFLVKVKCFLVKAKCGCNQVRLQCLHQTAGAPLVVQCPPQRIHRLPVLPSCPCYCPADCSLTLRGHWLLGLYWSRHPYQSVVIPKLFVLTAGPIRPTKVGPEEEADVKRWELARAREEKVGGGRGKGRARDRGRVL
jgi:hypothetical protein